VIWGELFLVRLQGRYDLLEPICVQRPEIAAKGLSVGHAAPGLLGIRERLKALPDDPLEVEAKNVLMGNPPSSEPSRFPVAPVVSAADVPVRSRKQPFDERTYDFLMSVGGPDQSINLRLQVWLTSAKAVRVGGRGEPIYSTVHLTEDVGQKDADRFEG
jgi:hypothetical protein